MPEPPAEPEPLSADDAFAAKATDLEALRAALTDAAAVSGGLWVSYLLALFYLLIAAGGVTHKDLLLENPVKLPFLGVDLPLLGFFALGPAIFLIVHTYVLLHFVVLARKAAAFDAALRARVPESKTRAGLRDQLPANIFVQLLAGPRDLRGGVVGALFQAIAWASLVLGPVLMLLYFLLQFLPYHCDNITWWQRIAIVLDLVLLWLLWPKVDPGNSDGMIAPGRAKWIASALRFGYDWEAERFPAFLAAIVAFRRSAARLLRGRWIIVATAAISVPLAFLIATFPGERLDDWATSWHFPLRETLVDGSVDEATRRQKSVFANRLVLPGFDAIDWKSLDKWKFDQIRATLTLNGRDLRKAILTGASLRRVDLDRSDMRGADLQRADLRSVNFDLAHLDGAQLNYADLTGASLGNAHLEGAQLKSASLAGASLGDAHLEEASLENANLRHAQLSQAHLQGAMLRGAALQGATLHQADLRSAVLDGAQMPGVDLYHTELQGSSFVETNLRGALLYGTNMQSALFSGAQLNGATFADASLRGVGFVRSNLQGALLDHAQLQGAYFDSTDLKGTSFMGAFLWRADAKGVDLQNANFRDASFESITGHRKTFDIIHGSKTLPIGWTTDDFKRLHEGLYSPIRSLNSYSRDQALAGIDLDRIDRILVPSSGKLLSNRLNDDLDEKPKSSWSGIFEKNKSQPPASFAAARVAALEEAGCAPDTAPYALTGIIRNLDWHVQPPPKPYTQDDHALASAFLDPGCKGASGIAAETRGMLERVRNSAPATSPTAKPESPR